MPLKEILATLSLSSIFAFRLLGLFMILPIFSLYAPRYAGANPTLIGVALGAYGLTQAIFQLPLGVLSDYIGRKCVIAGGLFIFALGSVIAATTHSMHGLILGRALQGAGAVGSTAIALVADLTSPQHRTKAMAIIGITIGTSFSLAMILGPIIAQYYQLSGIFWVCSLLGLIGIMMMSAVPKTPFTKGGGERHEPGNFSLLFKKSIFLFLNFSIFALHLILTASFIALPIRLCQITHLTCTAQWHIYLPVLLISTLLMTPLVRKAESPSAKIPILCLAIGLIMISEMGIYLTTLSLLSLSLWLIIFFTGFNVVEASIPSLISLLAPPASKGTAMGIYSTSQFLGIFVGGVLGGWMYGQFSLSGVFLMCFCIGLSWFFLSTLISRRTQKWPEALIKQ